MNKRNCFTSIILKGIGLTILLVTLAPPSFGTPPTPPAQIVLPRDLAAERVELKEPSLPFQIKQNEAVASLDVTVTQREMVPGKTVFDQPAAATILEKRQADKREMESGFKPALKLDSPGTYLIEIRIKGTTARNTGFSDRLTRYVVVTSTRSMLLLSPKEFQRTDDQKREKAFRDDTGKNPKNHPIRLLFSDTASVPKNIRETIKSHDVPDKERMIVRPEGPSDFLRKHSVDSTATSWSSRDNLTIRGRIVFQDFDGVWKPLVNVSVNIWDSDFLIDDHLGVVVTDWDGRWSFTCNDDDGWFQDGRDIYYTFKLENTRLSVSSCGFLSGAYEWKSAVHDDLSDGTVLDFGEETASDNMEALQVWSTLNLAWSHAVVVGGWDPGKVGACYPSSGTFYDGNVNVMGSDNDGPDSITHEYGHALMAHAYSGGDSSPGGPHGFGDCNQNQSLSWSEGWATGFMLSARPDGAYNWHEGDGGQPIEAFSSTCHLGETSEGWVAGALLDMMDSSNDDNGANLDRGRNDVRDHNTGNQVALATMLRDTMVGNHHNNILEFWPGLSGELNSSQRPAAQEIMNYDWMSVSAPVSCVASKVAVQNEKEPELILSRLRTLRDKTFKNWAHGRDLINIYYRNSPEIALILLANPDSLADVSRVMHSASDIGAIVADHQTYLKTMQQNPEVIPADLYISIGKVLELLERKGSAPLKRDIKIVRQDLATLKAMRLQELQERVAKEKTAQQNKPLPAVRQSEFSPGSSEALKDQRLQEFIKKTVPQTPP
jgi:hypothetical protein